MTLKDYFKIKVYPQYGGTMGEYEDLDTIKTFFLKDIAPDVTALKTYVSTPTAGLLDRADALEAAIPTVGSSPTMAQTYAIGKISLTGNPSHGETLVVGEKTYTFVSDLTEGGTANQILICATNVPNDTAKAIQYAINASTGDGHANYYGIGTTPNQDVVATAVSGDVSLTCEGSAHAATLIGKYGNDITLTENAENLTVTAFEGGKDITEAVAGKIIIANGVIYVAKGICTATESNWFVISADGA